MRNIAVVLAILLAICVIAEANTKGMTWTVIKNFANQNGYSMVEVGCNGCNPYVGDTLCSTELPILCYSKNDFNRPPYNSPACTTAGCNQWFQSPWSGGYISITPKNFKGSYFSNINDPDKLCMTYLGMEFRAVYHGLGSYIQSMSSTQYFYSSWPSASSGLRQPGGWNSFGYGQIKVTGRFWAFNKNAPANCWN